MSELEFKGRCRSAAAVGGPIPCNRFLKRAAGGVELAGDNEHVIGISQSEALAAGDPVSYGPVNAILNVLDSGAGIVSGAPVTSAAGGLARTALAGERIAGYNSCPTDVPANGLVPVELSSGQLV